MKVGKPKSKRVTVRLRHKIEKSSANKQRKERKDAKKNPQWRSKLKKDPGIPNLFPFKDKILAEIEESKRRKEEEQQRRREVAKAQREGRKVVEVAAAPKGVQDEDDENLVDADDDDDVEDDDDEMEEDTNPMAALLASAQARAQTYKPNAARGQAADDDEDDDEPVEPNNKPVSIAQMHKALPKQALADPIKGVNALLARLEKTQQGIRQLIEYYQLPPLITAGSDTTTRFLVDVARKRGRLGRGGIPNLNAAALMVLSDLNEERLTLPALQQSSPPASSAAANKSAVEVVSQMAEPFRIEGLFGDSYQRPGKGAGDMEIET